MAPPNLERQIKRHVVARSHLFFAVTLPGLEKLCARELARLSGDIRIEAMEKGGILFQGKLAHLYSANLHLRTAGRLLWRLAQFKATNFRQLARQAEQQPWRYYLPAGCLPAIKVTAHQSRLYHTKAVEARLASAIGNHWQTWQIPSAAGDDQTLYVRIDRDEVTLSLDSSGAPLYQRGLKTHGGPAPLRETMAAAILMLCGYDGRRPLLDPMCGAGTFSLEAALMAGNIAPGLFRAFAFEQWPALRPQQWQHLQKEARQNAGSRPRAMIHASDQSADACRKLTDALAHHGLDSAVTVTCADFFDLMPPRGDTGSAGPGLIVLNPPYGRRLSADEDTDAFYRQIGQKLGSDFPGWQVALLTPDPAYARRMPFKYRSIPLTHGGLPLTLIIGRVPESPTLCIRRKPLL